MIDTNTMYDDLKILFVESGYFSDEENCGYDEYIFAVRKQFLFDWLKSVADHEIDEKFMENWLRNEYTSEDSWLLYQHAKQQKEIVFERPMWCRGDNDSDESIYDRYNDAVKKYTALLKNMVFMESLLADMKLCNLYKNKVNTSEDILLDYIRKSLVKVEEIGKSGR